MTHMYTRLLFTIGLFRLRRGGAAILAVTLLSGCVSQGGSSADKLGGLMVAPGKYEFYNCAQLAAQTASLKARARELEALVTRAGPGVGGSLVSTVAYQPQYLQARGDLIEVRKAEAAKNCRPASPNAKKR